MRQRSRKRPRRAWRGGGASLKALAARRARSGCPVQEGRRGSGGPSVSSRACRPLRRRHASRLRQGGTSTPRARAARRPREATTSARKASLSGRCRPESLRRKSFQSSSGPAPPARGPPRGSLRRPRRRRRQRWKRAAPRSRPAPSSPSALRSVVPPGSSRAPATSSPRAVPSSRLWSGPPARVSLSLRIRTGGFSGSGIPRW